MDELLDVIREIWTDDEGGPVGRTVTKTVRIIYGSLIGATAKGAGPIIWTTRGVNYLLDRAGVPEDNVIRAQIIYELKDLDESGGFGVRILPDDDAPGPPTRWPRIDDPGPRGPGDDMVIGGEFDP